MTTNFFGTPTGANNRTVIRQYHFGNSSGSSYWAEQMVAAGVTTSTALPVVPLALTTLGELKTVSSAGAASTQVSVQNVAGTTLLVSFTTGSAVRVEPIAGAVFPISGNTTAVVSPLTTASKIQVEPGAGAVFGVSGNTTVFVPTLPIGVWHLPTGTTVTPGFAVAESSGAGTTALVTSGAGRIQVTHYSISHIDTASTAMVRVGFLSSANAFAAPRVLALQGGGANLAAPAGGVLFQTNVGEALNIDLSTNVLVNVQVGFVRTTA